MCRGTFNVQHYYVAHSQAFPAWKNPSTFLFSSLIFFKPVQPPARKDVIAGEYLLLAEALVSPFVCRGTVNCQALGCCGIKPESLQPTLTKQSPL